MVEAYAATQKSGTLPDTGQKAGLVPATFDTDSHVLHELQTKVLLVSGSGKSQ